MMDKPSPGQIAIAGKIGTPGFSSTQNNAITLYTLSAVPSSLTNFKAGHPLFFKLYGPGYILTQASNYIF